MTVSSLTKGLPGNLCPMSLHEIPARGWNVLREDLPLPVAVVKRSAVAHNIQWMKTFLAPWGASLCPHGKTTMSPRLHRWQLEAGAWGITLATVAQVQVARAFGIPRILMANQLIGRQNIAYILDELERDESFDFYALVDSVEGVALLAESLRHRQPKRPLQLLLELGLRGGRTGCRDDATAQEVVAAVRQAGPHVSLRGVEGFEGMIRASSPGGSEADVRDFLQRIVRLAQELDARGSFGSGEVLLSAGGSMYFDLVVEVLATAQLAAPRRIVVRSGCYLTHDEGLYRDAFARLRDRGLAPGGLEEGLRPALEVWAYVLSRPEPNMVVLSLGKRDVSFDVGLPIPMAWHRPGESPPARSVEKGHHITALHDQHAVATVPVESPWRVGDMVGCGISHPCATFDRWRLLLMVDDDYNVLEGIATYF